MERQTNDGSPALRITLGTRILLVLVAAVSASSAITVLLQEGALSADLHRAARARLERASRLVAHLADEHMNAQLERDRAVASTPRFHANVDARHAPTLTHFAHELAGQHGAQAIVFLDPEGVELAGSGDPALRAAVRDLARRSHLGEAMSFPVSYGNVPYTAVSVPLGSELDRLGSFVSVTAIEPEKLAAWSDVCRMEVSIGAPAPSDPYSLAVQPFGDLQLRVATTFDAERAALANSRRNLITGGLFGLALGCAASLFLARSLVRPIRRIQAATARIGAGELGFRLEDRRGDEVGDVSRAMNHMLEGLEHNIRERVRAEKEISHLTHHDSLTGLGNRRLFKKRLAAALDRCPRQESAAALILFNLDRFKTVNDTLGNTVGDELLREVARRLRTCAETIEPAERRDRDGIFMARLSGDEFALALPDLSDREDLRRFAERILAALGRPFELPGRAVTLGASLGIARSPDDAEDAETLLRFSDLAMAHAKDQGGNRCEFYADSMHEIAARKLALETRLTRALEDGEFELLYQPKLDLHTRRVTSVEALIRWNDAEGEAIGPDEFIPIAEETGAIVKIGDWALRKAIEQARQWQADGLPSIRVAVNVSASQIDPDGAFVRRVADVLETTGLDPRLLELEITEGALMRDEATGIAVFERLREIGVGLALDDFGTGYSSLSYLRQLPIDTLKIDRSFIEGVDTDPEDAALIGSIIGMAQVLSLRVVVEGVETAKQRRFLERLGCDDIQGFLISRPVTAKEAATIIRRRKPRKKPKAASPPPSSPRKAGGRRHDRRPRARRTAS